MRIEQICATTWCGTMLQQHSACVQHACIAVVSGLDAFLRCTSTGKGGKHAFALEKVEVCQAPQLELQLRRRPAAAQLLPVRHRPFQRPLQPPVLHLQYTHATDMHVRLLQLPAARANAAQVHSRAPFGPCAAQRHCAGDCAACMHRNRTHACVEHLCHKMSATLCTSSTCRCISRKMCFASVSSAPSSAVSASATSNRPSR